MSEAWYERAFESGYLDVYPHRDVAAARREIGGLVARGLAGRLLDLGCGFGRHTVAFREAGVEAFGMDLSADLLARSRRESGAHLVRGRLVRGDFRALPFVGASFDAVAMLFSSFGYFDDATNAGVLAEIARVLRADGTLVLDLMNAARVRATLVPESRTERDGRVLIERRRLTDGGRRVRKDVKLREPGGAERHWHEDVRMYSCEEIERALAAAGLSPLRTEGDFDGSPASAESPRRIVWARRTMGSRGPE